MFVNQGSNEHDSYSSTDRSRFVMLSAAKHLVADHDRPFASLRVTQFDRSNCQDLFFLIEPSLRKILIESANHKEAFMRNGKMINGGVYE
jgi:hypothetical protein